MKVLAQLAMVLGAGVLFIVVSGLIRAANAAGLAVKKGDEAPDFTLLDQNGLPVFLSKQRGQWVVLYFYPKDDTPGCNKEACSFRDNILAIQRLNATVLGVSVDSVASHKRFAEKYRLNFPILSDDQHLVTNIYGVLTRMMGMKFARRSTVIIDPDGIVREVFPSVKPKDHALEILETLKELQR